MLIAAELYKYAPELRHCACWALCQSALEASMSEPCKIIVQELCATWAVCHMGCVPHELLFSEHPIGVLSTV